MRLGHQILLGTDAVVNLVLGVTLLFFPRGTIELLGLPRASTSFYVSLLGAVIFGIGLALVLDLVGAPAVRGLALGGAIAINLCGGGVLAAWLLFIPLEIPRRGAVTLWIVAVLVLAIGLTELLSGSWREGVEEESVGRR